MTHSVAALVWGEKKGEDGVLNLNSCVLTRGFEIPAPRMIAGNDAGLVGGDV